VVAAKGRLSEALASVIFPSDCRIRESLLTTAGRLLICDSCLASFRRNPLESCDVCGVRWGVPGESDEEFAICPECREQRYAFERARRYGQYEGAVEICTHRAAAGGLPSAWVVPVPVHRQRKKERGFNQVEPFARPLARRLGIPYRPVLLMRTRPRPEKHLLD
jgi:predicted amidophosphoribosyltransferase